MSKKGLKRLFGKKAIISLAVFIVVLTSSALTFYFTSDIYTLTRLGYSFNESVAISKTIDKSDLDLLKMAGYIDGFSTAISDPDFDATKLKDYIDYYTRYTSEDISFADAVAIINHDCASVEYQLAKRYINYYTQYQQDRLDFATAKVIIDANGDDIDYNTAQTILNNDNFISDKLVQYFDYHKKYSVLSIHNLITLVNKEITIIDQKEASILQALINENGFNWDNYNRYRAYMDNNPSFPIERVVSDINNNIDKPSAPPSYSGARPADLSKGNLILVNKQNYLDRNYVPTGLVNIEAAYGQLQVKSEVYTAYKAMADAAYQAGVPLYARSPYRSYATQASLYNNYVAQDGQAAADRYSARPGYSEHQTGLAIDITVGPSGTLGGFANSASYVWLMQNAHQYGFILRYPPGKENITGYMYEAWHWRYLGVDVATKVKNSGLTYDEYYARYIK